MSKDLEMFLDIKYEQQGTAYHIHLFDGMREVGKAVLITGFLRPEGIVSVHQVLIHEEYRGKGFGKKLYKAIADVYHGQSELKGKPVQRSFYSKIALYLAKWAISSGLMPEDSWDERYIKYHC